MVASREHERTMRETNGGMREQKDQGQSRAMARPAPSGPTTFRRGTGMSQWGHEPLRRMREEFDKMVEQFFGAWPALGEMAGRPMNWGWDLQEDDNSMTVRAEAPGFEPSDFDVQVRGDQLILRASHKAEAEEKDSGCREWQQQEFYRSISLPQGTDHEKVQATYRNGILTVTLPKTEETKARHITVKGEQTGSR